MTSRVPDLAGLRLLVAVAREGSIGGAARATGTSQQSASERLRGIEAQTGLVLVQRGARGSRLTPAGVVVTEWAARLIEATDEIDTAIDGLREAGGRELVVWASMTVAESLVPRWLVELRRRQQGEGRQHTTVSLTAANSLRVVEAVRDGVARLGFVEGADPPSSLRSVVVAEDELVLVTAAGRSTRSRGGQRRRPLTAAEVAAMSLTSREQGSGTREVVDHALAERDLVVGRPEVELTTASGVREAVLAGSAPGFVSRRFVARDLEAGHLVEIPTELDLTRAFRAVWVGSAHPPAGPVRDLVAIARGTT